MGLVVTINRDVKNGQNVQLFTIEHAGETLTIEFYKVQSNYKLAFNNPKFKVTWTELPDSSNVKSYDTSPGRNRRS